MKNYFVIGDPIEHSLSPLIFNYLFDYFKINATYEKKLIKSDTELKNFMSSSCVDGFNITSPYKKTIFNLLDKHDLSALEYSSVNCIKKDKSNFIGFNTDGYGFLKMIKKQKINLHNKNILILGYGGSAKTISNLISSTFNSNLFIYGRNDDKINFFIDAIRSPNQTIYHYQKINDNIDIIINCLPGQIDRNSINSTLNYLNYIPINDENIFIDLNYNETLLNKEIINLKQIAGFVLGIDMLIFQALKTFEIWFGIKPNNCYEGIRKIIK